ncbi:hypothetical protein ACWGQL_31100 [Streptomyces lydicus]
MGQFWKGVDYANAVALLYPGDLPGGKLKSVTSSGTAAFEEEFEGVTIDDFTDMSVRTICDNAVTAGETRRSRPGKSSVTDRPPSQATRVALRPR